MSFALPFKDSIKTSTLPPATQRCRVRDGYCGCIGRSLGRTVCSQVTPELEIFFRTIRVAMLARRSVFRCCCGSSSRTSHATHNEIRQKQHLYKGVGLKQKYTNFKIIFKLSIQKNIQHSVWRMSFFMRTVSEKKKCQCLAASRHFEVNV